LPSTSNTSPSSEEDIHVLNLVIDKLHNIEYIKAIELSFDINLDKGNIIVKIFVHLMLIFGHHQNLASIFIYCSIRINFDNGLFDFSINLHFVLLELSNFVFNVFFSVSFISLISKLLEFIQCILFFNLNNCRLRLRFFTSFFQLLHNSRVVHCIVQA